MPFVRFAPAVLLLLVAAACSQSSIESKQPALLSEAVAAADEVIASLPPLCTTLRTEGYETRKRAVDDADATEATLTRRHCPDDLARLAEARALETAAAGLTGANTTVTFTRCAGTRTGFVATITITNGEAVPIGVYAAVRATRGGAPAGVGAFVVTWQLAPDESVTMDVSGPEQGDACAVDFNMFLADPSPADASTVAPPSPEQVSDDHAVWFPALATAERAWSTPDTATEDGPAATEDLRSASYTELVAVAGDGTATASPPGALCSVRPSADNPDLATVVATEGDTVVGGVVRRGADRAWRWLGTRLTLGTGPCP